MQNPRLRKLIGVFAFLAVLTFYVLFIMVLGTYVVPHNIWIELPFYILAGVAWVPLVMPLILWMETGKWRKPKADKTAQ